MKYQKKNRKAVYIVLFFLVILLACGNAAYATELPDDLTSGEGSLENEVDQANEDRFSGRSPWLIRADTECGEQPDLAHGKKPWNRVGSYYLRACGEWETEFCEYFCF